MLKGRSGLRILGVAAALAILVSAAAYLMSQSRAEATEASESASAKSSTSQDDGSATAADATDEGAAGTDTAAAQQPGVAGEPEAGSDADAKPPIPVQVSRVETGTIASYLSASANLVPENEVAVLAEAEGRVIALKVEEGDHVAAGQVLARLDPAEAEIALNKAHVRATNSELAFARAAETKDQGLISQEEFDRLKMEHEVARQEVAEAEHRLGKTSIIAPFAGRITERRVNLGQHLQPGADLFRIADFDPLIARIYLPERDVMSLREGRTVRIMLAADHAVAFDGAIRQISPVVDTATGTVKVTVEARRPPVTVRPGAFVTVDIVREQHREAVLVPRESVIRELRSAHVFIRDGAQAAKRPVTLGIEEEEMVEVLDGLAAGDEVIVAGQGGLKPGARIKVL